MLALRFRFELELMRTRATVVRSLRTKSKKSFRRDMMYTTSTQPRHFHEVTDLRVPLCDEDFDGDDDDDRDFTFVCLLALVE